MRLDLSDNSLTDIPRELGSCHSLAFLDVSTNQIKSIPAEYGKLENLQTLMVHHNQLKDLPDEIGKISINITLHNTVEGNMRAMKELDCSYNQLNHLPAGISQLHGLVLFPLIMSYSSSVSSAQASTSCKIYLLGWDNFSSSKNWSSATILALLKFLIFLPCTTWQSLICVTYR